MVGVFLRIPLMVRMRSQGSSPRKRWVVSKVAPPQTSMAQ